MTSLLIYISQNCTKVEFQRDRNVNVNRSCELNKLNQSQQLNKKILCILNISPCFLSIALAYAKKKLFRNILKQNVKPWTANSYTTSTHIEWQDESTVSFTLKRGKLTLINEYE